MKKMKKWIALALSLCMVLAMAACGKKEEPAPAGSENPAPAAAESGQPESEAAAPEGEVIKAVLLSAVNNESQAFSLKMFQKYAADYGFQVDILDDSGDAAKQADNVSQAVAQGYAWIIVNPTDAAGIVTSLKAAKEANPDILISTFSTDVPDGDSQQYRDFFVGLNDTDAGQQAANAFIKLFPEGAKIVEVGGQAGHNAQILRHDGYEEVMKDHPEFELIASQNTEHWATDEAQSIMEDFITTYGSDIDAVFCHWDNGATGCITALEGAQMGDVPVIGVDGCRAGFDQVSDGKQYATIMNNIEAQAQLSLELAQKHFDGEAIEAVNFTTPDIVTKDNIGDFTAPEW